MLGSLALQPPESQQKSPTGAQFPLLPLTSRQQMGVIVVGSVGSRGVLRLQEEERMTQISRRTVVKGMAAAGAIAAFPAIAACGDDDKSSGGGGGGGSKGGGTVSFGSNA